MATNTPRLTSRRLYFVCEAGDDLEALDRLLDDALAGGVDLIQLRDKAASGDRILEAAPHFRAAADRHGALFIINDRPELVGPCGADGVHVGQDDASVDEARLLAGSDAVIGLSTHGPEQLETAQGAHGDARPDYISVGPVWSTPTKPGRPATGLEYVAFAASRDALGDLPWFAIGGIDEGNVNAVCEAGASRIVVVRAIRDSADPRETAKGLRSAINQAHPLAAAR